MFKFFKAVSPISDWQQECVTRYERGETRSAVFRDLVLDTIRRTGSDSVVLDIGCGHAFDGSPDAQEAIARSARKYIGVEPDAAIEPLPHFDEYHNTAFESAPIAPASVDVAVSAFVLEHVTDAPAFWAKCHEVLVPGGIFWGFTVDARSYFALLSRAMEIVGGKDRYLNLLHGRRGVGRYENYPVTYRANTPKRIAADARAFRQAEFVSLHREGQVDPYFPRKLRSVGRMLDRLVMRIGMPGSVLVVRLQK